MSRFSLKVRPAEYDPSFGPDIAENLRAMPAHKFIDGGYLIQSSKPCVDFKLVHPPRTREQRKAAKRAAAGGKYVGFCYPEAPRGA